MKLDIVIPDLKKIQKYVINATHPLSSAFFVRNEQVLLYQEINIKTAF